MMPQQKFLGNFSTNKLIIKPSLLRSMLSTSSEMFGECVFAYTHTRTHTFLCTPLGTWSPPLVTQHNSFHFSLCLYSQVPKPLLNRERERRNRRKNRGMGEFSASWCIHQHLFIAFAHTLHFLLPLQRVQNLLLKPPINLIKHNTHNFYFNKVDGKMLTFLNEIP